MWLSLANMSNLSRIHKKIWDQDLLWDGDACIYAHLNPLSMWIWIWDFRAWKENGWILETIDCADSIMHENCCACLHTCTSYICLFFFLMCIGRIRMFLNVVVTCKEGNLEPNQFFFFWGGGGVDFLIFLFLDVDEYL